MLNIERLYREWPVFREVVDAMTGEWRSENDKEGSLDTSTREWLFTKSDEGEGPNCPSGCRGLPGWLPARSS